MKLHELKTVLNQHPEAQLRFRLPDGNLAPTHVHVTEVARVDKRFIDCGGTLRNESFCRLQTWHSDDVEHRLTAGKLLKIFSKAEEVLLSDDLDVDVEHEVGYVSQFPLASVELTHDALTFKLSTRHTACLASDKCGIKPAGPAFEILSFNPSSKQTSTACCSGTC